MRESLPKLNRDKLLRERELTEEKLEELLEVKVSQGTTWAEIKRNVESSIFIRFIVTEDFNIYISPGNNTHDGIMEDNGLRSEDCIITNGALWEEDDDRLMFSYQATPVTILHLAAEKKIFKFFEANGIKLRTDYLHSEEMAYD